VPSQEDVPRLLDELVRLFVRAQFEDKTQAEAIRELTKLKFQPRRIADLLDTTYGTVTVTQAKDRKKKRTTKKATE
jgi:hypothetical protein